MHLIRQMQNVDKEVILTASTFGPSGLRMLKKVGPNKFTASVKLAKATQKGLIWGILKKILNFIPTWFLVIGSILPCVYFGRNYIYLYRNRRNT